MNNIALYIKDGCKWTKGDDTIHFSGTLTNQKELRDSLISYGVAASEYSDTQIALSLILLLKRKNGLRLKVAIKDSMRILKGEYSFVVVSDRMLKKAYCVKNGNDLYVGLDYNKFLIGSEINKILSRTNRVINMEDGMMAEIFDDGTCFFTDAEGQRLNKEYRNVIGREIVNPDDRIVNILKKELSGVINNVFNNERLTPSINLS